MKFKRLAKGFRLVAPPAPADDARFPEPVPAAPQPPDLLRILAMPRGTSCCVRPGPGHGRPGDVTAAVF